MLSLDFSSSDSGSSLREKKFGSCQLCDYEKDKSELVILECKHSFCLVCLEDHVLIHFDRNIKCPINDCITILTESNIREVLSSEDEVRYDQLCMSNIPNLHQCLLPECGSFIWYDKPNSTYICKNCSLFNCIKCNAAHKPLSCSKYQNLSHVDVVAKCKPEIDRARCSYEKKLLKSDNVKVDDDDLICNDRVFTCMFCDLNIGKGSGVRLRSCGHLICRDCLKATITTTPVIPPKCQDDDCMETLQDREIYALLSKEELAVYERKSFTRVKLKLGTAIQCQQPNCEFFCELTNPDAKVLYCSKCNAENCLVCHAIHDNETCVEYQELIKLCDIGINEAHVKKAIENGECMECPDCKNLVKKGQGCNWIQCSNCGLELCWILKMRRWGPGGRGDTSGGCRCDELEYCHPDCMGCIPDN